MYLLFLGDRPAQLFHLFSHLIQHAGDVFPLEAGPAHPVLHQLGVGQCRKLTWNAFDRRPSSPFLGSLSCLQLFPVGLHFLGVGGGPIAKHVGMPAYQLFVYVRQHVRQGKLSRFPSDHGVEAHLQQQVSQLFRQALGVALVDGFQHLVTLFQQGSLQGLMGLFPVPGAAPRSMECFDDVHKGLEATQISLWNLFVAHGRIIGVDRVASQDNG